MNALGYRVQVERGVIRHGGRDHEDGYWWVLRRDGVRLASGHAETLRNALVLAFGAAETLGVDGEMAL